MLRSLAAAEDRFHRLRRLVAATVADVVGVAFLGEAHRDVAEGVRHLAGRHAGFQHRARDIVPERVRGRARPTPTASSLRSNRLPEVTEM